MRTLLLANRDAPEMLPLTRECCAAMLPIASKGLVTYAIESLAIAAVELAHAQMTENGAVQLVGRSHIDDCNHSSLAGDLVHPKDLEAGLRGGGFLDLQILHLVERQPAFNVPAHLYIKQYRAFSFAGCPCLDAPQMQPFTLRLHFVRSWSRALR
jgi:hypothetical protein